jgi:hypothetical protein
MNGLTTCGLIGVFLESRNFLCRLIGVFLESRNFLCMIKLSVSHFIQDKCYDGNFSEIMDVCNDEYLLSVILHLL